MTETTAPNAAGRWPAANHRFLQTELKRLRLLLRRRVLWLRREWAQDKQQDFPGLVISEARVDQMLASDEPGADEARFYLGSAEARAVDEAIRAVAAELAAQRRLFETLERPPAIDTLAGLFGLNEFERSVLLLCLAAELDPSFERLFAYVEDDLTRKYATPRLALSLFAGADWLGARDCFLPTAPLRAFHLVAVEPLAHQAVTPSARPLRLEERVVDYLLGVNQLDEGLAELLRPAPPALLTPEQEELVGRLRAGVEAGVGAGRWPVLNLTGAPHTGKGAVAHALCDRLGLKLHVLDLARLPAGGGELQQTLRSLEREAVLLQSALYLDLTRAAGGDEAHAPAAAADLVERLGIFLILGTETPWQGEHKVLSAQVPGLDTVGQRDLWRQALSGVPHTLNGEVEQLVQQFNFGAAAITRALDAAQARARLRAAAPHVALTADDLWQSCREQARRDLSELAQHLPPCFTWDDITLPAEQLSLLRQIAAQVRRRPKVYEEWGFGAKLSRGRGINVLFSGPSGTGKTMAAEILAGHLQLDLYRVDLAGVVSKYIGETEKNLRKVFAAAERSGAVLFFDEADALFGKRSEVTDSHDRYANIEINYLLQRMEEYSGLAILATNMKSQMDHAFLRRLRFTVDFPMPSFAERLRIWQKVFPREAEVEALDYEFLARLDITGGNIRNIALNAAFLAADEGGPIRMRQVLRAARQEYIKIDKLIHEAEFGAYYSAVRQ